MRSSLQSQTGVVLLASFSFAATISPFAVSPTHPPTPSSTSVTPKLASHWYDNVWVYGATVVLLLFIGFSAAWLCVFWLERRNRTGVEDRSRAEGRRGAHEFELTPIVIAI